MEKKTNDIAPLFDRICSESSIDMLQIMLNEFEIVGNTPVILKIRDTIQRHLSIKLKGGEIIGAKSC